MGNLVSRLILKTGKSAQKVKCFSLNKINFFFIFFRSSLAPTPFPLGVFVQSGSGAEHDLDMTVGFDLGHSKRVVINAIYRDNKLSRVLISSEKIYL